MKKIQLKICGMKYHNNIVNISSLNPDYMGFIFWDKSKRKMELDAIPEIPKTIKKVGVFVNAYFYEIVEKVHEYKLDFVQLHGNESPTLCKDLKEEKIKVIKAFSIDNDFDFKKINQYTNHIEFFLFDTKGKLPGGNGITFDWSILENYQYEKPYFLSGGIGINELEAIKSFQKTKVAEKCIAIDINSQFETKPGLKNEIELEKFKKLLYENEI